MECYENGVIERKNSHLFETTQAILFQTKAPKHFRADIVSTICFLNNCMPLSMIALESLTMFSFQTSHYLLWSQGSHMLCSRWLTIYYQVGPEGLEVCFLGLFLSLEGTPLLLSITWQIFGVNLCGIYISYWLLIKNRLLIHVLHQPVHHWILLKKIFTSLFLFAKYKLVQIHKFYYWLYS